MLNHRGNRTNPFYVLHEDLERYVGDTLTLDRVQVIRISLSSTGRYGLAVIGSKHDVALNQMIQRGVGEYLASLPVAEGWDKESAVRRESGDLADLSGQEFLVPVLYFHRAGSPLSRQTVDQLTVPIHH